MKWNKYTKLLAVTGVFTIVCFTVGFLLNCFLANDYTFEFDLSLLGDKMTFVYFWFFLGLSLLLYIMYYHKYFWLKNSNKIIEGNKKDNEIAANLEQARFQTEKEQKTNYTVVEFDELGQYQSGIPIGAEQKKGKYNITLAKNNHVLIIGTTGSGKTTTFINPSIQILSETASKPSMIISDPKGELFMLHAKSLERKGYVVKVIDLRNPFNSIKWNPLEKSYLTYQRMLHLEEEVTTDDENGTYQFEGVSYYDKDEIKTILQVRKQQLFDDIYEDLNDIMTVLCPITNKNEPIWESGAKNFVLAIALAMLEDSAVPELNLTVDKYNFYNIAKVATSTDNDCVDLINYFKNRSPVSRCLSLSKQVLESAEKTRGSYLSTLFDKLNIFADLSLCSLTSKSEITFEDFAEKPTALFLQIPDERETRHSIASMVILQAYKELVRKANSYPDLTLPRPVYFLLDEFGNLPAVHKLETMITVGRSRNIWLNLVVQSYAQLAKVYDEKVAEIIKSNCNIEIFIGTTDQKTIEEFSKHCGNYSVITRSVGYNTVKADDINSNASIKERPLIYPSELQQLNSPNNMGNAIVTVFGFQPIKSKFTPSFKLKKVSFEKSEEHKRTAVFFDEEKIIYGIKKRNTLMIPTEPVHLNETSEKVAIMNRQQIMSLSERCLKDVLNKEELNILLELLNKKMFKEALVFIETASRRANELNLDHLIDTIEVIRKKVARSISQSKEQIK